jgi:hypothetical protein
MRSVLETIIVGSDLDTIAARQVNVDRVGYRLQLVDVKRVVAKHLRHNAVALPAWRIAYREKQTRPVLVNRREVICRIRRTPCPVGERNPRS